MPLGQSSISVTLTHSSHFTMRNFIVIKYGIIFGGNSSNSGRIFTLQKKIIRIMAGAQPVTSCRSLLKELQVLPVPCLYILSLMSFIIIYQEKSTIKSVNILFYIKLYICIMCHRSFGRISNSR
jgi:hypothetical protein